MSCAWLLLFVVLAAGETPAVKDHSAAPQAEKQKRERLLEIYRGEGSKYAIYRDKDHKDKAELKQEPVYLWGNPVRSGGQDGAIFVWTCQGRAEALGCFFSDPATGPRKLNHELLSLGVTTLDVSRPAPHTWTPEAPGIDLAPIAGAPAPAATARLRTIQLRNLSQEFTGTTVDKQERQWELRLLAKPLYRYESTDPDVLDGAVFGLVSSAGTDPEAILVIEARRPGSGESHVWQCGVGRFTDNDLKVKHKKSEIFSADRYEWNGPRQDPKHRYRAFLDREIPAVEESSP